MKHGNKTSKSTFKSDLKFGNLIEARVGIIIGTLFQCTHFKLNNTKTHDVELYKNFELHRTIEVKSDMDKFLEIKNGIRQTIFIEKSYKGKPSGVFGTKAQIFIHTIGSTGESFIGVPHQIRYWLEIKESQGSIRLTRGGDGNHSSGYSVPFELMRNDPSSPFRCVNIYEIGRRIWADYNAGKITDLCHHKQ